MGAIWRYIHTKLKFRGVTMAVPDQVPFNQYTASGVSASFTYSFKILDADQLLIKLDGVAQTTGFTVGGVAADAGGVVTFSAAPAAGPAPQRHARANQGCRPSLVDAPGQALV